LERSLWIAATVNLVCALLAGYLATTRVIVGGDTADGNATVDARLSTSSSQSPLPFGAWVVVYGLTGFIALGLEIAWFRVLGVLLKSTSFTFGTLLAVYLCGLGAGAAVGARRAERSKRAGATFLMLQYAVTMYAALSLIVLIASIAAGHPIKLVRFLGTYDPVDVYGTLERIFITSAPDTNRTTLFTDFVILYLVVPALLIGPPTFLMGMSFPYLQKATQVDFPRVGRRLGTLLATNILGGVLGAVAVGMVLLPAIGTAATLKLLIAAGVLLAWPYARLRWPDRRNARFLVPFAAAAITALAIVAMPDGGTLWARLHATSERRVLVDEDGAGVSLVKMDPAAMGTTEIYVNGLGQSWIPYGNIHTVLGALPAFIHPAPADVAMIGLGSGDTAFAVAGRADVKRVVSIEILGAQRRTLERMTEMTQYPGLRSLLSDPRIQHRTGDGRAYLVRGNQLFDIIEADALRPSSAYAGNLYSREYFALVASRLKAGGLAVTWAPTERIRATFLDVFPHVLAFKEGVYIGSNAPVPLDAAAIIARAEAARDYYYRAGIDIVSLLRPYFDPPPQTLGAADRRAADLNTDMFPRDEFALPF
jgi:spermidine synthase